MTVLIVLAAVLVVGVLLSLRIAGRDPCILADLPKDVPCYQISVRKEDFLRVEEKIREAKGTLNNKDRVEIGATFRRDGRAYPITMHVRGDQSNHWEFAKKSWRISFPGKKPSDLERSVDLVIPEDRAWFAALVNRKRAKAMGLVQPRIQLVVVFINGVGPLLYLEIEHWSRDMFERQGVSGDIYLYQAQFSTYVYDDVAYWSSYFDAQSVENPSLEGADLLLYFASKGRYKDPAFSAMVDLLFGRKKIASWYAHSILAGNSHVVDDNVKLFFDLSLGRFRPVPWDVYLAEHTSLLGAPGNPLWNQLFAQPALRLASQRVLWDYVNDAEAVEDDLAYAEKWFAIIESLIVRDPIKRPTDEEARAGMQKYLEILSGNIENIRSELLRSAVYVRKWQGRSAYTIALRSDGPAIALLEGISLPNPSAYTLVRDDGDGVYSAADGTVATHVVGGMLKVRSEDDGLLWPRVIEKPALADPSALDADAPHLFYLVGPPVSSLSLRIVNAVTRKPAALVP